MMNQKRWIGVILLILGGLVILANLGVVEKGFWQILATYWPVVLIFAGIYNIATNPAGKVGGFIVLLAGSLFLVHNLEQVEIFRHISFWAVLLILAGLWFLFRGVGKPREVDEDSLNVVTIFSGTDNKVVSQEFKGGSSVSIFGGTEIDLREANLSAGEAKFDVFAMFGGADIYVPEGWRVNIKGIPLFGGWDDNTRQLPPDEKTQAPTLVIHCLVLFGGLDVSN